MGGIRVARIGRKSSIETEPRTLNFDQLDIAREVALYVVHTRSKEEAFQIFTEGLEPMEKNGANTTHTMLKSGEFSDEEQDLSTSNIRSFRRNIMAKDALTAPF